MVQLPPRHAIPSVLPRKVTQLTKINPKSTSIDALRPSKTLTAAAELAATTPS